MHLHRIHLSPWAWALYLSVAAPLVVACSSAPQANACPTLGPATCPDAGAPSYDAAVAAIVQQYCVTCHNPTGENPSILLGEYGGARGLKANYLQAEGQLSSCRMPNTGGAPIPDAEKTTLLTWLVCGAPDN